MLKKSKLKVMEVIEKLELELQKYLRLRRIFHMFEFICLAAIFIVFLFSGGCDVAEIFGCVAAVMIVPESFLSVRRSEIKASIKNENLLANAELDFCTKMKAEFEKECDKAQQVLENLKSIEERLVIF